MPTNGVSTIQRLGADEEAALPGSQRITIARSMLRRVLGRMRTGELEVRWSDDSEETFTGSAEGDRARIEIHDEAVLAKALVNDGSVGLGAAWIDGVWTTPDLAGFLELASRNIDVIQTSGRGSQVTSTVRRWWDARPDFARSHAIGEMGDHYNLGNDFYAAWLDETMTYSSALFADDDTSLVEAQQAVDGEASLSTPPRTMTSM